MRNEEISYTPQEEAFLERIAKTRGVNERFYNDFNRKVRNFLAVGIGTILLSGACCWGIARYTSKANVRFGSEIWDSDWWYNTKQ